MTPLISLAATLQDLFSNALFSLLIFSGKNVISSLRTKSKSTSLWGHIASDLTEYLQTESSIEDEKLNLFLKSPELESIVRQIYSVDITKQNKYYKNIEIEFSSLLSLYLEEPIEKLDNLKKYLFSKLLEGSQNVINLAIESGELNAHDAQSNLRFNILYDELATIKNNIDELSG